MTFAVNLATVGSNATATGTLITSGTAVASTSGTSIDFTGIPSWVKRITVMFRGVSTNGTSSILIRLGTSSGIVSTGYASNAFTSGAGSKTTSTTGFIIDGSGAAAYVRNGLITISYLNSFVWASSGTWGDSSDNNTSYFGGGATLADVATQVRITTVNGTDAFDAGTVNILYE
jgi:hypothetical protein